jgi:hypothetical protein
MDEQGNPIPVTEQVQQVQQEVQPTSIPYLPPENVQLATDYMTKAFGNNVDPGDFVTGVKMFVPVEVIEAIRTMGVDDFLVRVGGLVPGHPLLTQAGKNWSRKAGKLLVGE